MFKVIECKDYYQVQITAWPYEFPPNEMAPLYAYIGFVWWFFIGIQCSRKTNLQATDSLYVHIYSKANFKHPAKN